MGIFQTQYPVINTIAIIVRMLSVTNEEAVRRVWGC